MLPSRESSKNVHSGCHISGIKWLACSRIACDGKGIHKTTCTLNFLGKSWKSHLPFMRWLYDGCSKLICINAYSVTLLVCGFSENRIKLEGFLGRPRLRPLPPLVPAQNHCSRHELGKFLSLTCHVSATDGQAANVMKLNTKEKRGLNCWPSSWDKPW